MAKPVWLGAYQDGGDTEPFEFSWVTGEPWDYEDFGPDSPSDNGGFEDFIAFDPTLAESWNDLGSCHSSGRLHILVEWPEGADCNGDGFVDSMQILLGELVDTDGNGIPDDCERCIADLDGNGELNFFDISGFLLYFQIMNPIADFNGDGQFNFFDVSAFLQAFADGCP